MNSELLKHLSEKVGVDLKVRDKDEWMDESLDKRAEYIAKKNRVNNGDSELSDKRTEEEIVRGRSGKLD
jgi:hypothetical protein